MAENGGARRRQRLVLTASPFYGHMSPMLQLGAALDAKGFSITIAHSKLNAPDPSKHPDFVFLPLPDNLPPMEPLANFIGALNSICRSPFRQYLEENRGDDVVAIIFDNLMFFAGSVAADLNVPAIIFRSCSAAYVPPYFAIPMLHQQGRFPVKDPSILQEIVPELDPVRYKDLPFNNLPTDEILKMISFANDIKHPSAIIWNTIDFLEHSTLSQVKHHYKVPIFDIGPLHIVAPITLTSFLEEDVSCIPWLDKQAPKSVIYVSLGSLATMDHEMLVEMAWGLATSNQPFLWVVRPGSVHGSKWIEFLPEGFTDEISRRGLIVKWAPQREVLAHCAVGGFWSHCGWNSTLESVSEGVPMLCQPFNVDQGVNARYLSYVWKIGIELECMERGAIENAIRKLLKDKEGEEIRANAIEAKVKVVGALSHGGSSSNSLNELLELILSY